MYALYTKDRAATGIRYRLKEEACLFGCNQGWIPWLLQQRMGTTDNEPLAWHVPVLDTIENTEYRGCTLIIDIKPKNKDSKLHLSELIDVWGYSADGWTPLLMRTSPLFVEDDPKQYNREDFVIEGDGKFDPVYSTLYVQGSVEQGKISGKWIPPRASPTNSALLWPPVMSYFIRCIAEANPELLPSAAQQKSGSEGNVL